MSDPTTSASSEPRLVEDETKLATNPKGNESLEAEKPAATYVELGTQAATTAASTATAAASTATAAAANMKDNVFSMFGGGAKKEKKEEEEETNEPSGSSKAKKDAEGEDDVRIFLLRRASH